MSAGDFDQPPGMTQPPQMEPHPVLVRTAEEVGAYVEQVVAQLRLDQYATSMETRSATRRDLACALLANPSVKPTVWRVGQP